MIVTELWQQILVAVGGGVAGETFHWYELSRKPVGLHPFSTSPRYWVATGAMVLLGGVMPVLYLNGPASAVLCFHLGLATPLLLQRLVASMPAVTVRQGNRAKPSLRQFFSW